VSPIGFANDREALYARGVLATTRAFTRALAPVADTVCRPRPMRIAFTGHVVARPWQLPPEEAAIWTRTYAGATAFWDLLRDAPGWQTPPPAAPTTVAWGDRDRLLIYSRQAPRARRVLPGAQHVTLAGCGHIPTWDDPEQVARVLLEASA
jgi:pimeloyl-ACP methyl ester carboxylesterase